MMSSFLGGGLDPPLPRPEKLDQETMESDGRVLERLGVHRMLQFPAVGIYLKFLSLSVPCI